jgi:hypothetical protein
MPFDSDGGLPMMLARLHELITFTEVAFFGLLSIAFSVGVVVALWMLILGKFERPRTCPSCGAELPSKSRQSALTASRTVYRWGAIVFLLGLALALPEVYRVS